MACSSSTSGTTSAIPTPTSTADLGRQYLALVAPVNAASDEYVKTLQVPNVAGAPIRPAAQRLLDALVKFNSGLLDLQATVAASIRPDSPRAPSVGVTGDSRSPSCGHHNGRASGVGVGCMGCASSKLGEHRRFGPERFRTRSGCSRPTPLAPNALIQGSAAPPLTGARRHQSCTGRAAYGICVTWTCNSPTGPMAPKL